MGEWARKRTGKPHSRWEESWVQALGPEWWLTVPDMFNHQIATALSTESIRAAERVADPNDR